LDLRNAETLHTIPVDGWTRLVERTLTTEHLPFFASQISKPRFDLSLDDLPVLGLQLMEDLDESEARGEESPRPISEDHRPIAAGLAHAAHRQFAKSGASGVATRLQAPSAKLGLYAPESLEKLERLDDLVYEAIAGSPDSFGQLQSAWPLLVKDLNEEALAESREQYLRYALSVWEECIDAGVIRDPARAIQVLDVLCMLFGVIS
jgi:hypothetical protein